MLLIISLIPCITLEEILYTASIVSWVYNFPLPDRLVLNSQPAVRGDFGNVGFPETPDSVSQCSVLGMSQLSLTPEKNSWFCVLGMSQLSGEEVPVPHVDTQEVQTGRSSSALLAQQWTGSHEIKGERSSARTPWLIPKGQPLPACLLWTDRTIKTALEPAHQHWQGPHCSTTQCQLTPRIHSITFSAPQIS